MTVLELKDQVKEYGRDIKLNISSILSEEGAPGLTLKQILGIALASSYFGKNAQLIRALEKDCSSLGGLEYVNAAKAAASIMAMNNVYYRFTHLSEEAEFSKMPAKLRMSIIGNPGIPKVDFELMCLAVSALSGCGACMNAHVREAKKAGLSNEGVQSVVRTGAVIHAFGQALTIEETTSV